MHRPSLYIQESEEGPVHSCCVRRRNSEVLRTLLRHEAEPLDHDDQRKIVKALADEQVSYLSYLLPFLQLFAPHSHNLTFIASGSGKAALA